LAQKSRKLLQKPPRKLSNYKKAVKLEEGLTVARQKATLRFKKSKKGLELSIREHLGKLIDKIDIVDLIAILGFTFLIKQVIIENFEDRIVELVHGKGILAWIPFAGPTVVGILEFIRPILEARGLLPTEEQMKKALDMPKIEIIEWILSFALAYVIVKHGGALIGLLDKGLNSVVGMFLGALK